VAVEGVKGEGLRKTAGRARVLVINAGSSSVKVSLFEVGEDLLPSSVWEGNGEPGEPLETVIASMDRAGIGAVGHRIVHGGDVFRESVRITPEVRAAIARFGELAPEHNRLEVAMIEAAARIFGPEMPQVAAFDTAFHGTLAPEAYVYPGPYEWLDRGIRRYGFHGISHQYVSGRAAEILGGPRRMITCHLGNGCSLAAIRDGRSVDTTMGYTPLDGLMMGTRSGSVDPGILIHLMRNRGHSVEDLDRMLNRESGLKGVSGISGDMRQVIAAMKRGDERARLAFDIYVGRLASGIAGLVPELGGLEALVFTAGVGENSAEVRAAACGRLEWLGVKIDPAKNDGAKNDGAKIDGAKNDAPEGDREISGADSRVRVLVVHTKEQWQIAKECCRILQTTRER
jgi:acetate kinase